MTVIHQPEHPHSCAVAWEERPTLPGSALFTSGILATMVNVGDWDPPGTVRQCECGKTWVGYKLGIESGVLTTQWRPEGRFERWRRERKALKTADVMTPEKIQAIVLRIKSRHHP